jgi:hypothetical protein
LAPTFVPFRNAWRLTRDLSNNICSTVFYHTETLVLIGYVGLSLMQWLDIPFGRCNDAFM